MNDSPATRVNVPPPPRKGSVLAGTKTRLMATAPAPEIVPDNLSRPSDDLQDLNFKVRPELHREFKLTAVQWGMSMKDLLEACFNTWVEKHGKIPPR